MSITPVRHYRFEAFRLDTQTRELREGEGPALALTAKAFDTLCFLIENRHRVVSKDELLATVWSGRVVEENNLTQAISALRRAFGTNAGDHRYIVTLPGRGYRFVAEVQPDAAAAPVPTVERMPAWRRTVTLGAVLFMLALFAAAAWRQVQTPGVAPSRAALAVLPFRSLSAGPRDELLELGLAETLITRLSGSTSLRVRSLASSQRFSGTTTDPIEAGRQLGADFVLAGTIQRQGEQVRVGARLMSVRDGHALWSGMYDERIERVFTLQDRIATALGDALSVRLNTAQRRSPCDGADDQAYRLYLRGLYQLDRPDGLHLRQALDAFRQAVERDRTCARAYAGMAQAYRALAITNDAEPRTVFPLAHAAVRKALEIDPQLAEAHAALGFIQFWHDWDWPGAEASLQRALALNPSLPQAHVAYAHVLGLTMGRNAEAGTHWGEAMALDPLSPIINTLGSSSLRNAGRHEDARRSLERALAVEPDFWLALLMRGVGRLREGRSAEAIADLQRARRVCGDCSHAVAGLAVAYVRSGDRVAAERLLSELEAKRQQSYVPLTALASIHNALGREEQALALLERAYDERAVRMSFLQVDPGWDNLRRLPRFQALMRKMRLDPTARIAPQRASTANAQQSARPQAAATSK